MLEDLWAGMQDSFEDRKRGFHRLTVTQVKEFWVETNIPNKLRDDGEILDPTYDETMIDKRPLYPMRWLEQENVDIDNVSKKVVKRRR